MPKKTLTVAAVERIKPPASGQVEHFDLGFPGLALRVSYAGAKSWCFFYRIGGRLRRTSLGTYPAMSLVDAREAWRAARIAVSKGIDPSPRRGLSKADTFANVIAEWQRREQAGNKAITRYQVERMLAVNVLPVWGTRPIDSIAPRDVFELYDKIADRGVATVAGQVHMRLKPFFAWCVKRGILVT